MKFIQRFANHCGKFSKRASYPQEIKHGWKIPKLKTWSIFGSPFSFLLVMENFPFIAKTKGFFTPWRDCVRWTLWWCNPVLRFCPVLHTSFPVWFFIRSFVPSPQPLKNRFFQQRVHNTMTFTFGFETQLFENCFKSIASRACYKLLEQVKSVASRACYKLLEQVKSVASVASRACYKLLEQFKSVASRACYKLLEQFKSVASRACYKLLEQFKSVASRACYKLLEQFKSVASRACYKLLEQFKSVASRACYKLLEQFKNVAPEHVTSYLNKLRA